MKKTIAIAIITVFVAGCYYDQQTAQPFYKMSQDIQIQNQRNYEQQQTWLQQQRQEQERLDRINQQNNLIFELQKINYNLEQLHKDPIIFSSPPVVTPTVDFDR